MNDLLKVCDAVVHVLVFADEALATLLALDLHARAIATQMLLDLLLRHLSRASA